ncbi:uncharacterized protein LOC143192467 isoform X2 [Rhynchophorus ferrugineus]
MSDSDSRDSDEGIRYKTESVRKKRANSDSDDDSNSKESVSYGPDKKNRKKVDIHQHESNNTNISYKNSNCSADEHDKSSFGPSLPPNFKTNDHNEVKDKPAIGPALPPHLLKTYDTCSSQSNITEPAKNNFVGPQLPPYLLKMNDQRNQYKNIGPNLPISENLSDTQNTNVNLTLSTQSSQEPENSPKNVVGPILPPHLQKNNDSDIQVRLGPRLPSCFEEQKSQSKIIGPALPPGSFQKTQSSSDEDDDECYGPLPSGLNKHSKARQALEERALQLKIDQLDPKSNNEPVRETWMLELPAAKAAHFGLGPRQFRSKEGPDLTDRSSWTDIPNAKGKVKKPSVSLQQEAANRELRKRDKEQDLLVKKHKKRDKSLVEMHQEKLNQQKKEIAGPSERRPFSRDIDLQVNRFDEAQKKAVLKKAQLLDDRFSSGKAKYL